MSIRIARGFVRSPRGAITLRRRPDLFVSHDSKDKAFATKLSEALTKVGVDVFLDTWELEAGDSLHRSLNVALERSRFVGVIVSPRFARSEWCLDELSQALAREKQSKEKVVIPILLQSAAKIPFIADRVHVNFEGEFYEGVTRLAQVVHGLPVSRVQDRIAKSPPKSMSDVANALSSAGWDQTSVLDARAFDELKERLTRLRIPHVGSSKSISLSAKALQDNRRTISDLEGGRLFAELYPLDSEDIAKMADALEAANHAAPETFAAALLAAREARIPPAEIARIFDVSPGSISRWETRQSSPHVASRRYIIEKLIGTLRQRQSDLESRANVLSAD